MAQLGARYRASLSVNGTTQTSRSRPDMSVHWGEAVKGTPRPK